MSALSLWGKEAETFSFGQLYPYYWPHMRSFSNLAHVGTHAICKRGGGRGKGIISPCVMCPPPLFGLGRKAPGKERMRRRFTNTLATDRLAQNKKFFSCRSQKQSFFAAFARKFFRLTDLFFPSEKLPPLLFNFLFL